MRRRARHGPRGGRQTEGQAGDSRRPGRIVVPRRDLARRVRRLAREIADAYAGAEVTVLAVANGSVIFLADLLRHIDIPVRLGLMAVSSYPGRATESRGPVLGAPFPRDLRGRHVLIVDDILDTGRTLAAVGAAVRRRRPRSLRTCVLLAKDRPSTGLGRPRVDFVGFRVGPEFLVGYGLDFDNLYRNLPDLRVLEGCPGPGGG